MLSLVWANIPCKNGAIMPTKQRTAADRQRAADVRDWAAANGLTVRERGRIPAAVYAAYDAATAAPDEPAEPGPDWAAAGFGAAELDLDQPDPDEPPGPAPPGTAAAGMANRAAAPAAEPAPPPPASLDDARARLAGSGPPRTPPWAGGRGGGATQRPAAAPVRVSAATVRDIEGKLALLAAVPMAAFEAVDPACGGALAENLPQSIRAAVPLICQSETALRWLTEGGTYFLWLSLAQALAPAVTMGWRHHVSHTITVVNGRAVPARRLPDGRIVPAADAPPEPQQDWSAYTTDIPGHVPPVRSA